MKALMNNERGLSLVEVTIMLLVLMLLTSVLAPSLADFVNDAKWVKVKEDCEAIGVTVARVTRDVGPCLKHDGSKPCYQSNRVDMLYSDGPEVTPQDLGPTAQEVSNSNLRYGWLNWNFGHGDSMENQFVTNAPGYSTPSSGFAGSSPVGPQFGLGWRGAYMSPPVASDPWGHRYLVNSAFLAGGIDSGSLDAQFESRDHGNGNGGGNGGGNGEGSVSGGWSYDTFCISAGPNGYYETPVGGSPNRGVLRLGDDFTFIISGGTR